LPAGLVLPFCGQRLKKIFQGEVFLCGSLLNSPAAPATDSGAILAGGLPAFRLHVHTNKSGFGRAIPNSDNYRLWQNRIRILLPEKGVKGENGKNVARFVQGRKRPTEFNYTRFVRHDGHFSINYKQFFLRIVKGAERVQNGLNLCRAWRFNG
jgi:hypothetical protein